MREIGRIELRRESLEDTDYIYFENKIGVLSDPGFLQ